MAVAMPVAYRRTAVAAGNEQGRLGAACSKWCARALRNSAFDAIMDAIRRRRV